LQAPRLNLEPASLPVPGKRLSAGPAIGGERGILIADRIITICFRPLRDEDLPATPACQVYAYTTATGALSFAFLGPLGLC
jgi:hypothetical protein